MLVKILKKRLFQNVSTGAAGSVQQFPDDIAKNMIAAKIAIEVEMPKKKKEEAKETEPVVHKRTVKK